MLQIQLKNEQYEQDIRALLMAFYPGSLIRVFYDPEMENIESGQRIPEWATEDFKTEAQPLENVPESRHYRIRIAGERLEITVWEGCAWRKGPAKKPVYLVKPGQKHYEQICALPPEPGENESKDAAARARLARKNVLKKHLYTAARADTGRELTWGTLTGIRPAKIPTALLEQGMSDDEILRHMQEKYWTSKEKATLSLEIAKRERELIQKVDCREGYSLYVGIPFCPSTCAYCSFTSFPLEKWRGKMDQYVHCVIKELEFVSEVNRHKRLNTIYFGGGTPTTLEPAQMEMLCGAIERLFPLENLQEWTVEAGRPDSITEEKLLGLRRHPVTRISINPQSMKEETLRLIGRRHTVSQVIDAFYLARKCGFTNINMDLILGLPEETAEDVAHTMTEIQKLSPESLTIHTLALKRAARLVTEREAYAGFKRYPVDEMHAVARETARQMGLHPYYLYRQKNMAGNLENVGYAKEGLYGLYNILIMEEVQSIYAVGAGAATKLVFPDNRIERVENVKSVDQYMRRVHEMIARKAEKIKSK